MDKETSEIVAFVYLGGMAGIGYYAAKVQSHLEWGKNSIYTRSFYRMENLFNKKRRKIIYSRFVKNHIKKSSTNLTDLISGSLKFMHCALAINDDMFKAYLKHHKLDRLTLWEHAYYGRGGQGSGYA